MISSGFVQVCGINIGMGIVSLTSIFVEIQDLAVFIFAGLSFVVILSLLCFPDSPQWYILVGRRHSAMNSLKFYRSDNRLVPEMEELLDTFSACLTTFRR